MVKEIKLIKSTFLEEGKTKQYLCEFIMGSKILSMNTECKKFEENFSQKQGRKYSAFISSGSSANLLLIQAMKNIGKLRRGDKVLVSGLTWPTNIMPIMQLELIPILLDVEKETLNVSSRILKREYMNHPDAKCLFLTNALGFCSDIDEIGKFCKDKNILFLEDNCESLGSRYKGKKLGNFGLASTFSFFVSHHLSTIEGGMICTDDEELNETIKSARSHGWTRNNSQDFKERKKKENNIDDFYDIYSFYDLAYNFRPTEINGFIGNQQIKYLDEITKRRENNFKQFYEATLENPDIVKLNIKNMNIISNFGFPVILKDIETSEIYKKIFRENKIEIRPIISGSTKEQPFFKKYVSDKSIFPNIEEIHKNGFYFGNNPEMNEEEINRIIKLLKNKNE